MLEYNKMGKYEWQVHRTDDRFDSVRISWGSMCDWNILLKMTILFYDVSVVVVMIRKQNKWVSGLQNLRTPLDIAVENTGTHGFKLYG